MWASKVSPSRVTVKVPASSANLGPGFDCLAVALDIYLTLEVERTGKFSFETDLAVPKDRSNLAVRAFARLLDPDQFSFRMRSDIPLSGGLGSSAAAVLAGLAAADQLLGGGTDLLPLATEIEGHSDNAAAALYGGFVLCVEGQVVRIEPPPGLAGVLAVFSDSLDTQQARAALPDHVSRDDAVFNLAHTALLAVALERGDLKLLQLALKDRLHQDARADLYPRSFALIKQVRELGALGATISGAGPTVLLWVRSSEGAAVLKKLSIDADGMADLYPTKFTDSALEVTCS